MSQKGFATLEMILAITILGILSAVAIPRFDDVVTQANTARIQADLSTIDTAIALYRMENGTAPSSMSDLEDYIRDAGKVKPPTGSAYVEGVSKKIEATAYAISTDGNDSRATLDGKTSVSFTKTKEN